MSGGEDIGASICSNIVCTGSNVMMYGLDPPDEFPAVWDGQAAVSLVSLPVAKDIHAIDGIIMRACVS